MRLDEFMALSGLADGWEREAKQYGKQVQEARAKGLPHDCMLGMKTALEGSAKAMRRVLLEVAKDSGILVPPRPGGEGQESKGKSKFKEQVGDGGAA